MIRQRIFINNFSWAVYCYYGVDTYYLDEICDVISEMGGEEKFVEKARENMSSGQLNHGLTYSNMTTRKSVLVVGLTSSPSEFLNSFTHELHHLICHICEAVGLDYKSEAAAYLCGDTACLMYDSIKPLLVG